MFLDLDFPDHIPFVYGLDDLLEKDINNGAFNPAR